MSIVFTILIGFVVGVIAKLLHPGKENLGFVMTAVLGIAGSMAASFGGQMLGIYRAGEGAGFVGAIVGSVVLLVIYTRLKARS
ncbi:GlsB/YeaQ/YmgE family stress response membrane protein [Cognatazoarcus halotolerans]|uniref:GlsB/YeaQ/YmgE family stress response membrane protein n=1 Tax=Cognatazoarcus halotolerans TaxID=2686016 RepID=UPI001357875C|nr:GlsB/YeaQ/YmgE family stress response membrane protein [Cognatazoarcus halotolerans]MCB1897967.1 GlsB/YeaQ/YmgE family stress response membrane protein [Rhodocyclaceae bacterium]MCP5309628.1 GlsB/YeaQ/YmgE family stress response membrane protein [Zoogloeaceae bacterium]